MTKHPFGMGMPGRKYFGTGSGYRYGFNGQERSLELNENSFTAQYWQYDSRLGRRWNVDPKVKLFISGYSAFTNNPISYVDINGADTIDVKSKTYDINGKKFGQKGFNKTQMMTLFTAHTNEKSGSNIFGEHIEIRKDLTSGTFNNLYSISGAIAIGDQDGLLISRTPATILSINTKHLNAFFDAITYVEPATLESLRKEAILTFKSSNLSWLFARGIDKFRYFSPGDKYDIKSNVLKGRSFSYVNGIGIMESDYIGNMFYGSVLSNFQSLGNSLHDGDFLQNTGIDDVFDSHAIILGYKYAKTGININTFKSISNIILEKSTITNGLFYHTYDIHDTSGSTQIKTKN